MVSDTAQTLFPYPTESPDTLRIAQHQIGDVGALLCDTGADVNDGSLLLDSSWSSDSAATAISDVRLLSRLLPTDGGRLGTAAGAVARYVRALEDARDGIDAVRTRYDAAVTARDGANAHVPEVLKNNRYEREEYRQGNQAALDAATRRLDADYATELSALQTSRTGVLGDLRTVLDALAPADLRGPTGSYGQAAFTGVAITLSLVAPVDGAEDPVRRAQQAGAFERAFGRPPSGPTEWQTAAALDGTSHIAKDGDTQAVVQVGTITPQPGRGIVRMAFYIPSAEVFNVPDYDLGDNRGPDSQFDPEASRVTVYIDYETGVVVARQNPSVNTEGEVRVKTPSVLVSQTTTGAVRIQYDAENPFAPPDPTNSHTVKGDIVVTPPRVDGDTWRIDGEIGDYPAFEAYHDDTLGRTDVLLTDKADNEGSFGPLLELPSHHALGSGPDSDPVKQFGQLGRPISGPYYEYQARSGQQLGTVDVPVTIDPWQPFGTKPPSAGGYA
ncbi:MAG: hypothetical protein ABI776_04865 [Nocardioidaceae bacterium]